MQKERKIWEFAFAISLRAVFPMMLNVKNLDI